MINAEVLNYHKLLPVLVLLLVLLLLRPSLLLSLQAALVPVTRVSTAPPVSTTTVPSRARAARNSLVLTVKSVSISPCVSGDYVFLFCTSQEIK